MPFANVNETRLYYELTGDEQNPLILQFGGSLFGRQNFGMVNDAFRESFSLLSYDATGYGRSDAPIENYTIEGWADEGAGLLDALGIKRAFVHGTSMGGMIAVAFTAKYPEKTIAGCADCAFARCDVYRRTMFANWRRTVEALPMDEFCNLLTIQAVSATFIEDNPDIFDMVRSVVSKNSPYTVRHACLAMENMDLEPLVPEIRRPLLLTNGSRDVMTPPDLAPSGFSARQIAAAVPQWAVLHEFPEIGHADLLECPDEAVSVVSAFFQDVLEKERRGDALEREGVPVGASA
jgi:pimeloyl-ACP methyl ester carboxylesterase